MTKAARVTSALALFAVAAAGCATSARETPVYTSPNTDAPSIDNSDAAGPASVPGTRTVPDAVIVPAPAPPAVVVPPPPPPR